ncbi:MAG: alpha/beta fold hydrolase [Acidimicrobiales bacterium]
MSTVEVGAGRLDVEDRGGGSPVLWLSSSFGEAPWLPVHELLAASHRVVVPHPPTLEGTLADIHSMTDYLLHMEEVMDALGLQRTAVVGTSFGGWMAAELAALRPERVNALVLVDAMGLYIPDEPAAEIFAANLPQLAGLLLRDRRALDVKALPIFDSSADPMTSVSRLITGQEALARLGWSPYLHNRELPKHVRRFGGPSLVIWGAHDQVLSEAHAHCWCDLLNARLEMIEDAGHLPAIEQPSALALTVSTWLGA